MADERVPRQLPLTAEDARELDDVVRAYVNGRVRFPDWVGVLNAWLLGTPSEELMILSGCYSDTKLVLLVITRATEPITAREIHAELTRLGESVRYDTIGQLLYRLRQRGEVEACRKIAPSGQYAYILKGRVMP